MTAMSISLTLLFRLWYRAAMNVLKDLCFYTFMGVTMTALACASIYAIQVLSDRAADDQAALELIKLIGAGKGE